VPQQTKKDVKKHESVARTFGVAFVLCITCSIIVSTASVSLRPQQQANKTLEKKRNILVIAGLIDSDEESVSKIDDLYKNIKARVVDLEKGEFTDEDPTTFDQKKASQDPNQSISLSRQEDIAGIGRRENKSLVYFIKDSENNIETIILPVRGYGLWSTLHGFVALKEDFNTIQGFGFYDHKETPGLGGEVDNPKWRATWPNKKVYNPSGEVSIALVKGGISPKPEKAMHQIDALSGATLTSRGVTNLLKYWMGDKGFAPLLNALKKEGVQ